MDRISFGQKKFGEIGAILTGHAGDEGDFARWINHECTTRVLPSLLNGNQDGCKRTGAGWAVLARRLSSI